MERTLVIVKPDAVRRGLAGEIIRRIERKGLKIVALKMTRIDEDTARRHYAEHEGKPFYEPLVRFMTGGPVVLMAVEGLSAIATVRRLLGATNCAAAAPGSIRGDFGVSHRFNLVHGSDGPEAAARELEVFFETRDYVEYQPDGWDDFYDFSTGSPV